MKLKIKIFLLLIFFLLIYDCSFHRLQITKMQIPHIPFKETPQKNISPEEIRQELNEGHFRVAEQMLKTVSEEESENKIELHLCKGILYHRQNRLQTALREFEQYLSLSDATVGDETKRDIYHNLASLHYELNNFEKAALYYNKYRESGGKDYNEGFIQFLEQFDGVPYLIDSQKQTTNMKSGINKIISYHRL